MKCDSCLNGHAIVCGYGHLGERIAEQLQKRGCQVVVVDSSPDDSVRKRVEAAGCRFVEGDIRDDHVLAEAGIDSAGCLITATGDDRANLEAGIGARQTNTQAPVILRLFDQGLARRVESALDVHALSASFLASPAYVSAATDHSVASIFNVDDCFLSLSCGHSPASKNGKSQGLCVIRDGSNLRVTDVEEEAASCDERLFVSTQRHDNHQIRHHHKRKKGTLGIRLRRLVSHLHPVRLFREAVEIWTHAASISRSVMLALLAVGLFSVFMFSYVGKMNPLDALYFVVTTMTTTGYGDINLQHAPPGLKVYGILMMLSGAALMATIYAIIADYVLTARVEFLLGRREVNLRDHTVIVGLGKVGYRVAHDLKMLGVELVGIEANEDSDNVSAARLMFPVIIGDATRASILQKAGIERASVVLALTEDPMVNLSVALHARENNPGIKTIVRTYDIDLADKFKNFGLDEVISTSAIAAPAFVDAALYPGVQGSLKCGDLDVLVARHAIGKDSPFTGRSVKEIGEQNGIAVVLVADAPGSPYRLVTPGTLLEEGQRSVALLAREKVPLLSSPGRIQETR